MILLQTPPVQVNLPWYVSTALSTASGAVVTFLIFLYRWMDAVRSNHLFHIEKHTEQIVENTASLSTVLNAHDRAEALHHEEQVRLIGDLKQHHTGRHQ